MPKLNEVFEVIKYWGFEYKTVAFTWEKYDFGNFTRGGTDIFTDLEKAKKDAGKKAKKLYKRNLEIIEEQRFN